MNPPKNGAHLLVDPHGRGDFRDNVNKVTGFERRVCLGGLGAVGWKRRNEGKRR